MLQKVGDSRGYIIDVKHFHSAVREALEDYFQQLVDPTEDKLRASLCKKMDHICRIRTARGLLYEAEAVQMNGAHPCRFVRANTCGLTTRSTGTTAISAIH